MNLKRIYILLIIFTLAFMIYWLHFTKTYHKSDIVRNNVIRKAMEKNINEILKSYKINSDTDKLIQNLKVLADHVGNMHLELEEDQCSNPQVCSEVYLGNQGDDHWQTNAWKFDEKCDKKVDHLITLIFIQNDDKWNALTEIKEQYPNLHILTGNDNNSKTWKSLVDLVTTPYVFLALNLQRFPKNWGSFERGLHLLNS